MRPARIALLGVLAAHLFVGSAAARPAAPSTAAPTPPARVIVPPQPLTALHADYPVGASGDAQILLVLVVNADGSVRSATVAEGAEPFAAAAIAASKSWRFEPATRDGVPTGAAIRVAIAFTAPAPIVADPIAPAPATPSVVPGAPPPPPPPPPPPIEVTVRGELTPPGATSMSRAEVRLLPGAFGDAFRAIELLPGVTPIASGLPFFYVRGAPPGNVGYFLDGIRVPLLYHLGLGPSVINPALIDHVDLYPGGYPARYGGFAGGIVAGETQDPAAARHAEGNLRLFDAGGYVSPPFADGRGEAAVGGRYSYTAPLLTLLNVGIDLRYWDYQARVGFDFTPRDRVTIFAFGAYDYLANLDEHGGRQLLFDTTFHRLDLRYDHRFESGARLRQAVTLGWDQTRFSGADGASDRMLSARTEVEARVDPTARLRAGVDVVLDDDRFDLAHVGEGSSFPAAFISGLNVAIGARADVVWQVSPRLEFTPGLRFDLYEARGLTAASVDPRLASRLTVRPWLHLISTLGLASQPPSFILPGPGFTIGIDGGLQHSAQASLGAEVDLPADVQLTATVFHSAFFGMTDALGSGNLVTGDFSGSFTKRTVGSATGLEISLRRRLTRKLGGFLSYTLSRSNRESIVPLGPTRPGAPPPPLAAISAPSAFDRTHVLNLALTYDFGRGYKAGGRFVFYTGYPFANASPPFYPGPNPPPDPPDALAPHGDRLRPFYRLDARVEKKWVVGHGWLSLVLEVQNATLNKEVLSQDCNWRIACADNALGPVTIPSLGLEGGI